MKPGNLSTGILKYCKKKNRKLLHFAPVDYGSQLFMDFAIGGEYMWLVNRKFFSLKIGYFSPCFLNDEVTGSAVPCLKFVFVKTVKAAGRYPTKIDGSTS